MHFVAQGHAVCAGTCGFVVRLSKKPQIPAKGAWLCATKNLDEKLHNHGPIYLFESQLMHLQ